MPGAAGHLLSMTQSLTPAQQTQIDNRDDSGKWKSKTHADVDDTGEVLGLSEDPTSDNEEPLSFREAEKKYHDTFAEPGYVAVRRHHALEPSGLPRKDRARLKTPKVIRGFHTGGGRTGMFNVTDSRPGVSIYDIETVTAPVSEDEGSITENADGSWSLEDTVTGERWDVRAIDWEDTHHEKVGNPLEVTPHREHIRSTIYDKDVEHYKKALADDPGSVELRPTMTGYEYDQDQLERAERVSAERAALIQQAMTTSVTPDGRAHVEDSLDDLDVEGRWQIKDSLEKMDEPRYAEARANVAACVEAGYGRDSVEVPDRAMAAKLEDGQQINYKDLDQGPGAPWRTATVRIDDSGNIGYESEVRSGTLIADYSSGKSFHRDKWGQYIQSDNAGWNGQATAFELDERP